MSSKRHAGSRQSGAARYPSQAAPTSSLLVNETFYSIQGEGPEQGYPTFFIRLTGCNLRCGYCDTAFAFYEGERRSLADLVEEAAGSGARRVLVTGGEPMAQAATPSLCARLLRKRLSVSIETNGAYPLDGLAGKVAKVVDVKAPGSGEEGSFLLPILKTLGPRDALKFVLMDGKDYLWTKEWLARYHPRRGGAQVILSPAWGVLDPKELAGWVLDDHLEARVQVQLHKVLWENRRGV